MYLTKELDQEMTNNEIKSESPIVSVIILTYNQEKYVAKCINSVLSQVSEYSVEIILSDDQSTDGTQDIIRKLAGEYPDIIRCNFNENNLGIVKNYLRALDLCNGKYLCLIGGDDYWIDKSKIQKQVCYLELNPEYGLVYTDYNVLNEHNGKITQGYINKSKKKPVEGSAAHLMYKGINQIMSLTVCIRFILLNEEYKKIMTDDSFLAEDFPTFFWLSMYAKIHYISDSTAVYRFSKRSFTNSINKSQIWDFAMSHVYMRKKLMKYFQYKPDDVKETEIYISKALMRLSLKTHEGKEIGISSYKTLIETDSANLGDHIAYIGIKYSFATIFIRVILLIFKKIRNRV